MAPEAIHTHLTSSLGLSRDWLSLHWMGEESYSINDDQTGVRWLGRQQLLICTGINIIISDVCEDSSKVLTLRCDEQGRWRSLSEEALGELKIIIKFCPVWRRRMSPSFLSIFKVGRRRARVWLKCTQEPVKKKWQTMRNYFFDLGIIWHPSQPISIDQKNLVHFPVIAAVWGYNLFQGLIQGSLPSSL